MKDNTLDIKTVCECNRCLGCKTLHPQVSIINLENPNVYQDAVKFEFYAILLIEDCEGGCDCCGRKYYDYSNATMVFLTPGEIFRMNKNNTLAGISSRFIALYHVKESYRQLYFLFLPQGGGVASVTARNGQSDVLP